jgi:hypothetical protein
VTVSTLGSDYDTILSVYQGPCHALVSVPDGCNDDDPRDGAQSTVSFAATAGTTYFILVSAFDADGGELVFELTLRRAPLCIGDCDGDAVVTSNECQLCDEIRGGEPLALCPACDRDGSGQVTNREVNQCLLGVEDCIPCVGDCDGSGRAAASDLVTATSNIANCPCNSGPGGIAIGCPALPTRVASCVAGDRNGDGCVSAEELTLLTESIFQCSP